MSLPQSLKGFLKPNHVPVNKFSLTPIGLLLINGVSAFTFLSVDGIGNEIEVWETPERTTLSRGITKPFNFTAVQPLHHKLEYFAMEAWYKMTKDPIIPGYMIPCEFKTYHVDNTPAITLVIESVFPLGRKFSKFDVENVGEISVVEWSFSASDFIPLPF